MGWCMGPRKGRWREWIYSIDCLAVESYSEILSKVELLTPEAHFNTLAGQSTNLLGSWTAK